MQVIILMVWVISFPPITTNNNQLTNDVDYIAASSLNSYALTSKIPTNNNPLTNDAGYITPASLATVSSGNITYQGTGEITGGGTSNANQNNSTIFNFDLTSQTKQIFRMAQSLITGDDAATSYLTLGALNGYSTQNWVWTVINSLAIKTRQDDPTDPVNNYYCDNIANKSVQSDFEFDVCNC